MSFPCDRTFALMTSPLNNKPSFPEYMLLLCVEIFDPSTGEITVNGLGALEVETTSKPISSLVVKLGEKVLVYGDN